jgi:hypothetical protein
MSEWDSFSSTDTEQFRSSRSGRQFIDNSANRNRSGQVDHDVFEGLPVRRWSRQPYTFSQTPKDEPESQTSAADGSQQFPELPMPRDSHLLSPSSRALLRAARAGYIYLRRVSNTGEGENEGGDAEESATIPRAERTFTARKWTTLPRHLEPPEVEFLAKRRPGLSSLYGTTAALDIAANGSDVRNQPMRKTKLKKVDATTGNITVYEVWVPEGHMLEGEITEDVGDAEQKQIAVPSKAPAPRSAVKGDAMTNVTAVVVAGADSSTVATPPQKHPPPLKRKAKGIEKGRKKRVMFAPGEGANVGTVHGHPSNILVNGGSTDEVADIHMFPDDSTVENLEEEDGDEVEGEERGDEQGQNGKTGKEEESTKPPDHQIQGFNDPPSVLDPPVLEVHSAETMLQPITAPEETKQPREPKIPLDASEDPNLPRFVLTAPETRDDPSADLSANIVLAQEKEPAVASLLSAPAPTSELWPPPTLDSIDGVVQVENPRTEIQKAETSQIVEMAPMLEGTEDIKQVPSPEMAVVRAELVPAPSIERAIGEDTTPVDAPLVSDLLVSTGVGPLTHGGLDSGMQQSSEIYVDNREVDLLSSLEASLGNETAMVSMQENERVLSTSLQSIAVEEVKTDASASDNALPQPDNTRMETVVERNEPQFLD